MEISKGTYSSNCCSANPIGEIEKVENSIYAIGHCSKCGEGSQFLEYFPVPRAKEVA